MPTCVMPAYLSFISRRDDSVSSVGSDVKAARRTSAAVRAFDRAFDRDGLPASERRSFNDGTFWDHHATPEDRIADRGAGLDARVLPQNRSLDACARFDHRARG